jgi:arylsulfatase A
VDGVNLLPVLLGKSEAAHETFFFYRDDQLWAVRKGPWKLHYVTKSAYGQDPAQRHETPLLFNLDQDPSEQFDVADKHADVVAAIHKSVDEHKATMKPAKNQLEMGMPPATRPATRPAGRPRAARSALEVSPAGLLAVGLPASGAP